VGGGGKKISTTKKGRGRKRGGPNGPGLKGRFTLHTTKSDVVEAGEKKEERLGRGKRGLRDYHLRTLAPLLNQGKLYRGGKESAKDGREWGKGRGKKKRVCLFWEKGPKLAEQDCWGVPRQKRGKKRGRLPWRGEKEKKKKKEKKPLSIGQKKGGAFSNSFKFDGKKGRGREKRAEVVVF